MFKEAFFTVICFVILYLILRILQKKKELLAKRLIIAALCCTLAVNIAYNIRAFFPELILDGVNYLGDAHGNLFLVNRQSEFPDQILFPVLQNRRILTDPSADFYSLFLRTFSKSSESYVIPESRKGALFAVRDRLSFSCPLKIARWMDYAFPENHDLESLPTLYLDEENLTGQGTLIAFADDAGNLYLLAQSTYREVTGDE